MVKKILLNNNLYDFSLNDLPCFIHGRENAGSSLFTMSLLANLEAQGNKLLSITAYPMAREEFIAQTVNENDVALIESVSKQQADLKKRALFVKNENVNIFIELAKSLPDIEERIILLKNIDILDKNIFDAIKNKTNIILSGDIDNCYFSDELLKIHFKTKIVFSAPQKNIGKGTPILPKYTGYLVSQSVEGEVKLAL